MSTAGELWAAPVPIGASLPSPWPPFGTKNPPINWATYTLSVQFHSIAIPSPPSTPGSKYTSWPSASVSAFAEWSEGSSLGSSSGPCDRPPTTCNYPVRFGYDSVQPVSLVVEKELGAALAIRILRSVEQSKIRPHALVHRTVWSVAVLHHPIVASPRRVDVHLGFHQHMPLDLGDPVSIRTQTPPSLPCGLLP